MTEKVYIPKQPLLTEVTESYYRRPSDNPEIGMFYSFEAGEQHTIPQFFSDNTIDIMFYADKDGNDPRVDILGQRLKPGSLDVIHPEYSYFGVRLIPGIKAYLFDLNLTDIKEQNIFNAVDYIKDKSLVEKITHAGDFKRQQEIFTESFFLFKEKERENSKRNIYNFLRQNIIEAGGNISISELVERSGYSERYIKKIFTEYAAIGPKQFSRIVRFQNLINLFNENIISHGHIDFIGCACELGFSDQAHMIREMRAMSGYTPTEYLNRLQNDNYANRLIKL